MVRRALRRKRKLRKVFKKMPSGKTVKTYKRRKSTKASCAICKKKLQGVNTSKKLSKTQKKSGRKFSGMLCHGCTMHVLKLRARVKNKELALKNVEIRYRSYL